MVMLDNGNACEPFHPQYICRLKTYFVIEVIALTRTKKKKKKKKKLFACRALWAEWSGRCLLRVHCRCATLLVLC
jgi:hypothetical protein